MVLCSLFFSSHGCFLAPGVEGQGLPAVFTSPTAGVLQACVAVGPVVKKPVAVFSNVFLNKYSVNSLTCVFTGNCTTNLGYFKAT